MLGIIVAYGMQFTAGFFFLQSVLCCLPLRSEKYWLRLLAWIGYTAVATITVFPQDAVNITVLLCVFLLLNFVLCKGKWLVKIAVVLVFFPMAMAVQFLYLDVCGRIFFHYYTVADQMENEIFSDLGFLLVIAFWGGGCLPESEGLPGKDAPAAQRQSVDHDQCHLSGLLRGDLQLHLLRAR